MEMMMSKNQSLTLIDKSDKYDIEFTITFFVDITDNEEFVKIKYEYDASKLNVTEEEARADIENTIKENLDDTTNTIGNTTS